jgi:hypothetical protein
MPTDADVIPAEGWLLICWSDKNNRWELDGGHPVADHAELRERAEHYRQYYGRHGVRVLHTADG